VIRSSRIKEIGKDLGIDDIKVTSADPFANAAVKFAKQLKEGLFFNSRRLARNSPDSFYTVKNRFPPARSIIAGCLCYLTSETHVSPSSTEVYGSIARYTWRNHYRELRHRLKKLGKVLKAEHHASFQVYSNGPFGEKPIAERSGIGYYGKHSIIIHPRYGSWIVLGELITDIEIEPDHPLDMNCEECMKCLDLCPTKAIIRPYVIDRNRCIQALTNWYGIIPDDIAEVWENRLYGCTTCQDVCPKNHDVIPHEPRTDIGHVGSDVLLTDILTMDETTYRTTFSDNQMTAYWINFAAIQRNALIALGNLKAEKALPIISSFTNSPDPVLSHTAQWAAERIQHE
jgi:epoxyqueuosine reductase